VLGGAGRFGEVQSVHACVLRNLTRGERADAGRERATVAAIASHFSLLRREF
jgi:hypothetical protein